MEKHLLRKKTLKISESWVEISFLRSFSILVGILLGPVDLFGSREDMILIISYLSVGLRKKESSDLFLRKLEKFLWEYLILSLVLARIDVKKLLNMFAISIGSALVVSLETRILGIFEWALILFKKRLIRNIWMSIILFKEWLIPFHGVFNVFPISFKVMIIVIHFTFFKNGWWHISVDKMFLSDI